MVPRTRGRVVARARRHMVARARRDVARRCQVVLDAVTAPAPAPTVAQRVGPRVKRVRRVPSA